MAMKDLADITTEERLQYDFTEEINKLDAKINPLTVLTNQISKRGTVNSVVHYWYQEELDNRWDTLGATLASDGATVTVSSSYARFHQWDVVKIPETGWVGIISGAVDDASLDCSVINDGSGEATAGENVLIMGPSIGEGSGGVTPYQGNVTPQYNLTTTLQRTFKVTRETMVNAMHGGKELERLHNKKGREFARDLEYHLWHGIRLLKSTGPISADSAQAHRFNGGLLYYMKDIGNATSPDGESTDTDINGALTESAFQSWLFDAFKYTDTLYLFCGKYGLQAIDNWARGKLKMVPSDKSYGLNITEYPLAGRMAYIVDATRVLEASPSGETDYEGTIVALDLADIKFFWYVDQTVKLYTNLETAKQALNQREDGFQCQFTIEMGNAKRHSIADGITGVG